MEYAPPPRRRKRLLVAALVCGTFAFFIFLFCSGLHFPLLNARSNLQQRLSYDLHLSLPPSATITHATRFATIDPAEYYAVQLSPADLPAFLTQLQSAPHARSIDPTLPWQMGPQPDWWQPQTLPGLQCLDLPDGNRGYIIYYSPTSPTLYIFWFEI